MKNLITLMMMLAISATSLLAQKDAPDFTVKDLNGVEYNLYSILEEDKIVIFDVSATWCPPCYAFHKAHYLKSLNDKYGPEGTDQAVIIFYEADPSTTLEDLQGTGSNTRGDWITGTNYPIINESTISVDLTVWAPLGYPTINVISRDKKIVGDLFDQQSGEGPEASLQNMENFIAPYLKKSSSVEEVEVHATLSPNPTSDILNIRVDNMNGVQKTIKIFNAAGQEVRSLETLDQNITLDVQDLAPGTYVLHVSDAVKIQSAESFVKQ